MREAQAEPDVEAPGSERPDRGLLSAESEPEAAPEVEGARAGAAPEGPSDGAAEAEPGPEAVAQEPDADGSEAFIALHETQARAETHEPEPSVPAPEVREIDLEPKPQDEVEPSEVVRIADRDAAGDHEPTQPTQDAEGSGKRRWSLFRRGGS